MEVTQENGIRSRLWLAGSLNQLDLMDVYASHDAGLCGSVFLLRLPVRLWELAEKAIQAWDLLDLELTGIVAESHGGAYE